MTKKEKAAHIAAVEERSPGMVYAGGSNAYDAFTEGKVLFDLGESTLVDQFTTANSSEFGKDIAPVRTITWQHSPRTVLIYGISHRQLSYKRQHQQELWRLEEFRELDGW